MDREGITPNSVVIFGHRDESQRPLFVQGYRIIHVQSQKCCKATHKPPVIKIELILPPGLSV